MVQYYECRWTPVGSVLVVLMDFDPSKTDPQKRDPMGADSVLWYAQRGPRNANGVGLVVLVYGLDFG